MRRTGLALALTVVLLWILLSQTDLGSIAASFRRLSPAAGLAGLGLWAVTNWLRALRYRELLLSGSVPLGRMTSIVNLQNLLASITPGRAGELSYVLLVRRDGRVPASEGLGGLVLARVFDLVVVCGVALAALLAVRGSLPPGAGTAVGTAAAMFAGAVVLLLQLAWLSDRGVALLEALLRWTRLGRWASARRAVTKAREVHAYILRAQAEHATARLWLLTLGIWASSYAVSWLWILGVGISLPLGQVIFVAAVAGLAGSLPIQGLAGLGTTEAGWAIPLVLVGVGREQAVAASFCFHALAIAYVAVLGGLGALHLSMARRLDALSQASE